MKILLATGLLCLAGTHAALAGDSPWNGTWTLAPGRAEPDGAAADYRFTITKDHIRWEIPSLHEVNVGTLDGTPMRINRPGAEPGLTLSVRRDGPRVLRYAVQRAGQDRGEGIMTLALDGRNWTDVPLDHGTPVNRLTMIYIRNP